MQNKFENELRPKPNKNDYRSILIQPTYIWMLIFLSKIKFPKNYTDLIGFISSNRRDLLKRIAIFSQWHHAHT